MGKRINDFDEEILRGAFADSLREGDKLALVDHDASKLLARTRNGSLKLAEDTRGLHFEIAALPKTSLADVKRDAWQGSLRTLEAIDLREISIVNAWPAYPQTTVTARSAALAGRSDLARRISLLELGGR